jgi:hypothetical protein
MEQLKSLLELIATPAQKIVIIDLVNIFNRVNFTGYLYALEGLFTKVENNEIELSIALSSIFEIVTDQCYDVALAFGITLFSTLVNNPSSAYKYPVKLTRLKILTKSIITIFCAGVAINSNKLFSCSISSPVVNF